MAEPKSFRPLGGLGSLREKDGEIQEVVNEIKPTLEEKTGLKFDSLDVLNYKHQIVAGKNFFVKVRAKTTDGKESILHLRIYQDLRGKLDLTAHQLDKTEDEELKYFQ